MCRGSWWQPTDGAPGWAASPCSLRARQAFLLAENVYGDPSDFSGKIVAYDESNPTRMLTFSLDKFQELSGPEGLAFFPDERCAHP